MDTPATYQAFYHIIAQIPSGQVATYGQIALLAGLPGRARQVGYALHAMPAIDLPWHRVVNAQGRLSLRQGAELQHSLLETEGVQFSADGQIDLKRYQWRPGAGAL
ncbi:MAG: MGMT family protein [Anaerolineales bacterium]|nr:MGMT family protein [Anaerolineales bacterium]